MTVDVMQIIASERRLMLQIDIEMITA